VNWEGDISSIEVGDHTTEGEVTGVDIDDKTIRLIVSSHWFVVEGVVQVG